MNSIVDKNTYPSLNRVPKMERCSISHTFPPVMRPSIQLPRHLHWLEICCWAVSTSIFLHWLPSLARTPSSSQGSSQERPGLTTSLHLERNIIPSFTASPLSRTTLFSHLWLPSFKEPHLCICLHPYCHREGLVKDDQFLPQLINSLIIWKGFFK